MKNKRLLTAFILMNIAVIAALAWFVFSNPEGSGNRADSAPDAGIQVGRTKVLAETAADSPVLQASGTPDASRRTVPAHAIVRSVPAEESEVAGTAASSGDVPLTEQPQATPQADPKTTALSEHIAYGPAKSDGARPGIVGTSGGMDPAGLSSEMLDTSPVAVPFALLDPAPSTISSPEQVAALDKLREGFASAVGGPKQDPASKAYRDNWKAAQPSADQRYRQWFGDQAYAAQQRAQYLELHPAAR